jgi:hypothetical protein
MLTLRRTLTSIFRRSYSVPRLCASNVLWKTGYEPIAAIKIGSLRENTFGFECTMRDRVAER